MHRILILCLAAAFFQSAQAARNIDFGPLVHS